MNAKISPTMQKALAVAREHGGVLVYWQGGFWTWEGCPSRCRGIPSWSVETGTIKALVKRGWLAPTAGASGGWVRAQVTNAAPL
jgi:hypothetical protein